MLLQLVAAVKLVVAESSSIQCVDFNSKFNNQPKKSIASLPQFLTAHDVCMLNNECVYVDSHIHTNSHSQDVCL